MGGRALLLVLAFCVAASAEKKTLIPSTEFKELNTDNDGGAFNEADLSWATNPADISISTWLRIMTGTDQRDVLIQVFSGSNQLLVYWRASDKLALYYNNESSHFSLGPDPQYGAWIHMVVAVVKNVVFFVVTFRISLGQFSDSDSCTFPIDSTTNFLAPFLGANIMVGTYTDAVVFVNESPDLNALKRYYEGTFLCGTPSGPCATCHPTCGNNNCDGSNQCLSCANTDLVFVDTEKTACKCKDGLMGADIFHSACGVCVMTNEINPATEWCFVCAGCDYCYGSDPAECLETEQGKIATLLGSTFSLPLLTEDADHQLCFYQHRPLWWSSDHACGSTDPIEIITGDIDTYSSGSAAKPTPYQCFKLLHAGFPSVKHWFAQLFQNFVGPAGATEDELVSIKTVLYSWILNFGPAEMEGWTNLKAAMSAPSANWASYLGWLGTTPRFTVDGNTALEYPPVLLSWLSRADGCKKVTAGCPDLLVFNLKSTVCGTLSCPVAAGCTEAKAGSDCAN